MKYYFSLNLSTSEFLPYYQGTVQNVVVTTTQGIKVQFPAMHLRKYLSATGIKGDFCLQTQQNKFLALTKVK
ncbi:hypothetical protein CMT41_08270 [Colwellia sp. MT41]|uniref:DUF2835 domain-containing protein n=1 Tax=Colwellia marinimaniae TaxID=1513592 RepID=A0ABQ0MV34_9GAMM|nr:MULTISPECIES: DUF2835 family protein [Colwellia]ALO34710.1 hypothetical protein CMT41_08270 [Colwellia sp. MT41]GAW96219.1 hypothetical protein MTCD1_01833 [Colwellia marinimaniae]